MAEGGPRWLRVAPAPCALAQSLQRPLHRPVTIIPDSPTHYQSVLDVKLTSERFPDALVAHAHAEEREEGAQLPDGL